MEETYLPSDKHSIAEEIASFNGSFLSGAKRTMRGTVKPDR